MSVWQQKHWTDIRRRNVYFNTDWSHLADADLLHIVSTGAGTGGSYQCILGLKLTLLFKLQLHLNGNQNTCVLLSGVVTATFKHASLHLRYC